MSEGKVVFLIWIWEKEICKLYCNWRLFWNPEMWKFLLEPIFKKVTWAGLNSLKQKRFKNWKMIFHDSIEKYGFQNSKIKLNSTNWVTLECSVMIFQALKYMWAQWPQQPQQPQWPQWPRQPHFTKWIIEFYVYVNHGTKIIYPGLTMWNESSKTHYFIEFWHPFSRRLLRPTYETKIKSKG